MIEAKHFHLGEGENHFILNFVKNHSDSTIQSLNVKRAFFGFRFVIGSAMNCPEAVLTTVVSLSSVHFLMAGFNVFVTDILSIFPFCSEVVG